MGMEKSRRPVTLRRQLSLVLPLQISLYDDVIMPMAYRLVKAIVQKPQISGARVLFLRRSATCHSSGHDAPL
jgi:hypothetical protein